MNIYRYGRPPEGVATLLRKECKKIIEVKTWEGFFAKIGLPSPSNAQVLLKLLFLFVMFKIISYLFFSSQKC